MKLQAERGAGNYIQSITDGAVLVSGQLMHGPVIVSSDQVVPWAPVSPKAITLGDLAPALDMDPEVILLGTGTTHQFVDTHLATAIMRRGIGFEAMASPAACRTYNILAAEDRRVVAAILV